MCILLIAASLLGGRIGEAKRPGPQLDLDDSQASALYPETIHDPGGTDHWSQCGNGEGVPQFPADEVLQSPASAVASAAPGFVAAKAFGGPRQGMAFKLGPKGLGYYSSVPVYHLALADMLACDQPRTPPTILRLDDFLGLGQAHDCQSRMAHTTTGGNLPGRQRSAVRRHPRRRPPRGARHGPLRCLPGLPRKGCSDDAAVRSSGQQVGDQPCSSSGGVGHDGSANAQNVDTCVQIVSRTGSVADTAFRGDGLWAIDSVNASGWYPLVRYLEASSADYVVAQEVRRLPHEVDAAEATLRVRGWKAAISPAVVAAKGGTSCGTLVSTLAHLGSINAIGVPVAQARWQFKRLSGICRGGFHLGSLYLHCSVGVTAKVNLDMLQEVAASLHCIEGPWALGGDFQCTPKDLAATGWLTLIGGVIACTELQTCGKNEIDFFVVSKSLQHAVAGVQVLDDAATAPHCPVRLLLRSRPRAVMVRQVAAPGRFGGVLPYGPEPHHDESHVRQFAKASGDLSQLDVTFAQWITEAEARLSSLCCHDTGEALRYSGRAAGPAFKWRVACGRQASSEPYSAYAVCWKVISNWLRTVADPPSQWAHHRAMWRVLHAEMPRLEGPYATTFESWRSLITPRALASPPAVSFLHATAVAAAAAAEQSSLRHRRAAWSSWLHEGPSKGLGRQHRLSRCALGWIPSAAAAAEAETLSTLDVTDGLSFRLFETLAQQPSTEVVPLNIQESANFEAAKWSIEWDEQGSYPVMQWPSDLGPLPPPLQLDLFRRSLASFPVGTGLSWDGLHPRALNRLSDEMIWALIRILTLCEWFGRWPAALALIMVVLIPKDDGGLRPIGLLPAIPRIWMRARREATRLWEAANERSYIYAGAAKGAHIAAWKQAARAEMASLASAQYAQVLLDLVKAFERVPHDVLLREAIRLQYPLWLLRLSLATYRLARVLRVEGAISRIVVPNRGLTAGSGFATTELRVLMTGVVDTACSLNPTVTPTLFVDDLSAEVVASRTHVVTAVVSFMTTVCRRLTSDRMQISETKTVCTASAQAVGREIEEGLSSFGILFVLRTKSLGVGMGAGARRNAAILRRRLSAFRRRVPRFRALRRARINTARLLRTGGVAALSWGEGVIGIPPSILLQQRRAAAAATCAEPCGQSIDIALILADGPNGGRADPAFDAHQMPICQWAQAVWESWLPVLSLQTLAANASKKLKHSRCPWKVVVGPGSALVATSARLGWIVKDAVRLITDQGRMLQLDLDPPIVIKREVAEAVKRWRWREVEKTMSSLHSAGSGAGAVMAPLWKLLTPKSVNGEWTRAHQEALRSLLANRQWTQQRLHAAQQADGDQCQLCLADIGIDAPTGTLFHRAWVCKSHDKPRCAMAPLRLLAAARQAVDIRRLSDDPAIAPFGNAAFERALFPVAAATSVTPPSSLETFVWHRRPAGGTYCGTVYSDGSRVDGPDTLTGRLGWSFVVLDGDGVLIASASGLPPAWIRCIGGAESWAALQAAMCAEPGSRYRIDCLPCVDAIHKGLSWATALQRPLARVFGLLITALDGTPASDVVWMPAHTAVHDVGVRCLSDGSLLTWHDRLGNSMADELAKAAALAHRVPARVRQSIREEEELVDGTARWLAHVTLLANAQPAPDGAPIVPLRDSAASRQAANVAKSARLAARAAAGSRPRLARALRPVRLGGHLIQREGPRVRCLVCRRSSMKYLPFASQQCSGPMTVSWSSSAQSTVRADRRDAHGHVRSVSGDVIWCTICGSYATNVAKGLQRPCVGPPSRVGWRGGGRRQQLAALRAGFHPRTGAALGSEHVPVIAAVVPDLSVATAHARRQAMVAILVASATEEVHVEPCEG